MKAPKKKKEELDDDDKAFLERKKKEQAELKAMAEKAKQKGPLVRFPPTTTRAPLWGWD